MRNQSSIPSPPRRNRAFLPVAAGVLIIAFAAVVVWRSFRPIPPPSADPVTLAKFVASDRFNDLSEAQKRPYRDALRRQVPKLIEAVDAGRLSEEQHLRAARRAMGDPMKRMADEYFSRAPGPERDRYLDQVIDEQETMKRQMPPPHRDGKPPVMKSFKPDGAMLQDMAESRAPENEARTAEFTAALQKRRTARGLSGGEDGVMIMVGPGGR